MLRKINIYVVEELPKDMAILLSSSAVFDSFNDAYLKRIIHDALSRNEVVVIRNIGEANE